jgi:hypothetical protein
VGGRKKKRKKEKEREIKKKKRKRKKKEKTGKKRHRPAGLGATISDTKLSYSSPTPRSTGLLNKLSVAQLIEKFPAFYGKERFITRSPKVPSFTLSSVLRRVHILFRSKFSI